MNRRTLAALALALPLPLLPAPAAGLDSDADAKAIAVKVTTAGAAMFDARDAKGLAATYTADARLEVIGKDKDTGELKTELKRGRAEIEAYYQSLFKDDAVYHARNTVEYARQIDPDLIMIAGVFEPDTQSGNPMKLPFVQVRSREGDAWRIVNLQVFFPR